MPVLFFALWVALNGRLTWEIAAFGAVISGALYWFCCKFLDYSPKKEWKALQKLPAMVQYFGVLVREIIKANFMLMDVVFHPSREIKPKLVTFHTPVESTTLRAVLADSITVTPGTLTVASENGELTVHCLDESFASGIEDTEFQRLLLAMEKPEEEEAE